ncbi:TrmH family RNA methyltransferase [Metallococcus carri]|uniref:TrmH family RNA methyltransferase n=1 Tax=Metallococcus carri TaxID=1656884 RepID=UPI002E2CF6F3|nr:TrmH family RNA methyltransferase [Metallococcus carri]
MDSSGGDLPVITDRGEPAIQRLVDLARSSRGTAKRMFLEDPEPLLQAIAAGVEFVEVYGVAGTPVPGEVLAAATAAGIPLRLIDPALAGDIFKVEKKPKVFGVAVPPAPARLHDLAGLPGDIVVLDGVRIVGNIGAIVRTSVALGAAGIVLLDSELTTIADRRLLRASRGYVFSLPVVLARPAQAEGFFAEHKDIRLVNFDAHGDVELAELGGVRERLALMFGSEKTGASASLARLVRSTVSIPMNPAVESLNVSVSVGIALQQRAARNLASLPGG